jgi:nucleotide-binding universal stress UspA family protein
LRSAGSGQVVVGVSDTLAAYEALRFAIDAARERRASLIAVRAVKTTPAADTWPDLRQTLHDAACADVAQAFEEALGTRPSDVDIRVVTGSGTPHRVLPAVAFRPDDLLVVGASRHTWPRTHRRGVGRHCARTAICPVVVVPARAFARSASRARLARSVVDDVEAFLRDHG